MNDIHRACRLSMPAGNNAPDDWPRCSGTLIEPDLCWVHSEYLRMVEEMEREADDRVRGTDG